MARVVESLWWSAWLVLKLEVRVKRGEVERNIWSQMGEYPVDQPSGFARVVVEGGDHQIGDLEPDVRLVLEPLQRVENRRQVCERDLAVEILGEGLQVDIGRVDVIIDIVESFAGDVAVRDHDRL